MGTATTTVVATMSVAVTPASVDVQPEQKLDIHKQFQEIPHI